MAALFLIAVFLLSAGFAKIMAICVNRLYSLKLPRKYHFADKVNLLLISAYPILLAYGLGWHGPRLLIGGTQPWISPAWRVPIGLGAVGFVLLVHSAIRHWRYRPPSCEVSAVHEIVDLRVGPSWKEALVGDRHRTMALLPGNEQFLVDIAVKTYQLPRLPPHWDGISLVHLSDFHFYHGVTRQYFETVCEQARRLEPDLFVFSGDLLDDSQRVEWLAQTLGRLKAPLGQYFILGNHDWDLDPDATRRELVRLGWTDLAGRTVSLTCDAQYQNQPPLTLAGDETPWMGTHPDFAASANGFRILVSHTPDNIVWARQNDVDLVLAGHTHGGQIQLPILGPVYSPSRFDCRFASGVFWLDPTLMYVSRGVSGKEPLRYNCPPEVTKLILTRHPVRESSLS